MLHKLRVPVYLLTATAIFLHAQPLVEGPLVLFIGPPGSGKSFQAQIVANEFSVPIISVDDLIRSNRDAYEKYQQRGLSGMVPHSDPALNTVFGARISAGGFIRGLILDGYPSTKDHADYVRKLVLEGRLPNPVVIQLDVRDDVIRKRLASQVDDALDQRIKDYRREMGTIRLYFPNAAIHTVDGSKKPEAISKAIRKILESKFKKK